jgi:branched-chain amino acid transport system permease protein
MMSLLRRRWKLFVLPAVILLFPLVGLKSYFVNRVGILVAIYAVNVTGMTLLTRYGGVISLGHSAFYAFGAYISAILTTRYGINPWAAMFIGAISTVTGAYIFSVPFLKLRRAYLAMATLGLGEAVVLLIKDLKITGGVSGIPGIPRLSIGSIGLTHDWQIFYIFGLLLLFFAYLTDNLGQTRLGRAYHAIRTNETAAKAMGINSQWELCKVFCFSALICSLTGSVFAHFIAFISPESFSIDFSFALLIIVIIGGANIWGAILTTVVLTGFSEVFRGFQDLSMGFYGLLLVMSLFVFPEGLSARLLPGSRRKQKSLSDAQDFNEPGDGYGVPDSVKHDRRAGHILEVSGVSKRFGGTEALSKVSLTVDYNQIVGIIGPNGAGKTTLLNVINGFLKPGEGHVVFRGADVTRKAPHEMARIGLCRTFQLVNLFKGMTVLENVMVGGHLKGDSGIFVGGLNLKKARLEESLIRGKAMESLRFLGLIEKAYDPVESLSFGEQRLVEIARALTIGPDLLLLDEPAAGLNTAETEKLADTIGRLKAKGITIVLVEHNMPLVMSISDMVYVLEFGRGIAFGTPDEIMRHEEVIRAYLGQEAENAS